MNEISLVWRGLIAGLIIAVPVGPVNMFCVRQTLAKGWRSGLLSGLGAAAVDTLYGTVAAFSIRFIIRILVQEQFRIRLFGGMLLLIIGIAYFFKQPVLLDAPGHCAAVHSDLIPAILLNLMNPTAVLSFLAILAALGLAARGESTEGRVPSAAWAGARRRDAGDAVSIVEERQRRRCPRSAGTHWAHGYCGPISALLVVNDVPASHPPRALSSARKPHARGLLYFHHGLLGHPMRWWSPLFVVNGIFCGSMGWWIVLSAIVNRFRGRFTTGLVIYMNRVAGLAIGGFGVVLMVLSCART
jgi:threonine/homoserine/homoserine lactone efflux protein